MTETPAVQSQPAVIPVSPRTRRSWLRTIATTLILLALVAIISGYVYITDSSRVKSYAQQYLSELTGARVTIGHASLSIFEGLRLDDLKVLIDDAPIFEAKTLQVDYDTRELLKGNIDPGRVLVIEPHVRLIENVDQHEWNFDALYQRQVVHAANRRNTASGPVHLPQIVVRNARVDYAQTLDGRMTDVGTLHLEGQFAPDENGDYRFTLQSRGEMGGVFPIADGWVRPDGSQMSVEVRDVEFVNDIKTLLPARVREFWQKNHLAGRMNRARLDYARQPDGRTAVTVLTELAGVDLTVPPDEWMAESDRARIRRWRENYGEIASPAMGGSPMAASLIGAMYPQPLHLNDVDAAVVFTDDRIHIENLVGRLDANRIRITGNIDGYTADAGARLRIESLPNEPIALAASPAFIPQMPWPVQELYYRFRPIGQAILRIDVIKKPTAAKVQLSGELTIHDAKFAFDRFPYPADRANGTLRFTNNPATGEPELDIVSVQCHGFTGGANATANIEITGKLTPLDAQIGADLRISGQGLTSDAKLIEAMPPATRKAVRNFDSAHTGSLPKFDGDFDCRVHRDVGLGKPWLVTTALDIRHGEGSFVGFPYPIHDVNGQITIYDDHLTLAHINLPCDQGTASLTGDIFWQKHDPATGLPIVQTDLTLQARHVAFDDKLLNAIPPEKGVWLRKIGLKGIVDIDGKIVPMAPESDDPAVNLAVKISDGSASPMNGVVKIDGISGDIQIDPTRAVVTNLHGHYGAAPIDGQGTVVWTGDEPQVSVAATMRNLKLDDSLTKVLPPSAAGAVRSLHAEGAVDAELSYDASTHNAYRVLLRPQGVSLKPDFLSLPFTQVKGAILLEPGRVTLQNITSICERSPVSAAGTINTDNGDANLALAARDVAVSDRLTGALPGGLGDIVRSIGLKGHVAFDCSKLVLHGLTDTTQPSSSDSAVDFDTKVWLQPADLRVGVNLSDMRGMTTLSGRVQGGELKSLDGNVALDSLKIADRAVTSLNADLHKSPDKDVLQIGNIDAKIAGGNVAGQIDTAISKADSRFALNLQVRGAKVSDLTGDITNAIGGTLTASLEMEGKWSDTADRHGRGDVLVQGRDMYRVPVLFGMMQVANLALPNNTPIQQATIRYTIDGPRLMLDEIDLRAVESVMQGSGEINFDTKKVGLQFGLANSAVDALPIFGGLIKSARQGLLQIRITGTLQAPKVQANAFNIFSTTVDDVKPAK